MGNLTLTQLKARVASIEQQLEQFECSGVIRVPFKKLVDESFAQALAKLTDDEAVQYLKSANDSIITQAYLILSKRLSDSALAEICFEYVMRPTFIPRLLGASEIGIYLQGTCDRKASQTLALMIRNSQEDDGLRRLAFCSLELINKGMSHELNQPVQGDIQHDKNLLGRIDWKFVDLFL